MVNQDKVKTIIIEDNIEVQQYLNDLLAKNVPDILVSGCASRISDAINLIKNTCPELILMDVELEDGLAFSIFEKLDQHDFEVIFISAHSEYLKSALEHYALSFITKPISDDKLVKTVNRYLDLRERLYSRQKLTSLNNFLKTNASNLLIQSGYDHISLSIEEIISCEADGNYTKFHLNSGKSHLASNTLKYYFELLEPKGFFKPNRSVLININHIKSIYKKEAIILKNGAKVSVSVRNKEKLVDLIQLLS